MNERTIVGECPEFVDDRDHWTGEIPSLSFLCTRGMFACERVRVPTSEAFDRGYLIETAEGVRSTGLLPLCADCRQGNLFGSVNAI